MKKIGFVGGISWTSTLDYYKYFNQGVNEKLGGLSSPECIIHSLNFSDIQERGWTNSFDLIFDACKNLVSHNVDAIVLCANTAHLFADEIQSKIDIPIIHIAEATAIEIKKEKLHKIGLLGTKFTMEMDFYRKKLKEYDIETIVPSDKKDIEDIQNIVKNELGKGLVTKESKKKFIQYANALIERGAEGIILGCTEIPMLINQKDFKIPVFDTTKIHVESVINFTLDSVEKSTDNNL
ncbi:aspartate/glutamate racemase family protein [Flagellimonas nanhaiensis]|uniref:Aspartate/glutamate racemase family protein n=1 Tax=Flagellimonas nanhaiensis TaxID=2292706 RepID=A0A371JV79_9FLAO|nr:aspartate/glutamate racemase family protein [Allomuricauda nanhaiensis]RDY61707.1 aspartate/glutamate racemase family protein [Allomuricauda nanhaiensis]